MVDVKFVLWVSQPPPTTSGRVLSRRNPISDHLLLYKSGCCPTGHWLGRVPLLLTLRGKSVLVHLAVIVKIVEHEVQIVINLLSKMVNDSLFSVYNDLYVILLYKRIAVSRANHSSSRLLQGLSCCICCELCTLWVHIVTEGSWLREVWGALGLMDLSHVVLMQLLLDSIVALLACSGHSKFIIFSHSCNIGCPLGDYST
jgi:hypothetical protein